VNKLMQEHFAICQDIVNAVQDDQLVCSDDYDSTITCVEDLL
jgi:hypothetical protein